MKHKPHLIVLLFCSALLASVLHAAPSVRLPNGELTDSNLDIQVKVLGGTVSVRRTWTNGRWYFNPLWAGLKFKLDDATGEVTYVDRAGTVFERSGNGDVYVFDSNQFIRKLATSGQWRWYDRMGNYALYTDAGVLVEYADKNGVKVSIESDTEGRPTLIKDHFDNPALSFSYVGEDLDRVTDRTGRFVQYSWQNGRLSEVRDVMGYTWSYGYDSNGQLIRVTDPESRETKVTYVQSFVAGEVAAPMGISFTGRPGRDFRISRVATLEDALGRVTQYQYEYSRDRREFTAIEITPAPISRTLERVYDLQGRLLEEVVGTRREYERRSDGPLVDYIKNERGLITRTERDSYRNVISVQHPDGTTESWKYLPALSYVTEYTDELGVRSTYAYDANGRITEAVQAVDTDVERRIVYTYTPYGQVQTRTVKGQTPADDATTSYVYDDYGNAIQTTDAENQVTEATYDVMGNVLTRTDARGKTTTMTYTAAGWLETTRTPLGFLSEMEYDQTGNRTKSIGPIDGTLTSQTLFRYDDMDRLIETEDPLGGISKYRYDEEGRLYESEDARGVVTQIGFDASSRMTTMTDGNGNVTETVYGDTSNALEGLIARKIYPTFEESYKYDQRDRQVEVTQVLSPELSYTTTTAYDAVGNMISSTDAKGRTTQRFYDERSRMTKEIDPLLGETRYTYDARDNLLTVTDANGNTHRFTYDKVNRKLTEARPMGETIVYGYDPNGNLIERTSPNGARRVFVYDDDNRLEREEHYLPGQTDPDKTITYQYDQRSLLTAYDDGLTAGVYTYDAKGQKITETITFGQGPGAFSKTLTRTYEPNGLPKSLTYPGSTGTVNYSYDSNNQLRTYQIPGLDPGNDTLTYSYRWNAIETVTMPGNLTRTVTLDPLQRPTRILVQGTGNNGEPVMDHRYEYDRTSNITRKTTLDGPYNYSYDALDRLTGATPPPALLRTADNPNGLPDEAYTYDNVHNRLTSAHQPGPWIYNANNELTQWGTGDQLKVIDYDDNGSTISEQTGNPVTSTRTYIYDAQDRMVEVRDNEVTIMRYAYDPMGRRTMRQPLEAAPQTTWFLYSDDGLIGEFDASGVAIREYGWLLQRPWSTDPVWQKDTTLTHLTHNDHLFTTEALTATVQGALTWSTHRESFGRALLSEVNQTTFNLRFPGQHEDTEEITYNLNRWYMPATGVYISEDYSFYDSQNLYIYAVANPVNYFDANGMFRIFANEIFNVSENRCEWNFRFRFYFSCILGRVSPEEDVNPTGKIGRFVRSFKRSREFIEDYSGDNDANDLCACREYDSDLQAIYESKGYNTPSLFESQSRLTRAQSEELINLFRNRIRELNRQREEDCPECIYPWDKLLDLAQDRSLANAVNRNCRR